MPTNAMGEQMGGPARTIYYFAFYMVMAGVVLIAIPRMPLAVFGLPEEGIAWIRILGSWC
jgi:hypothetical protein